MLREWREAADRARVAVEGGSARALSLDVFDTLLLRRTHADCVQRSVERSVASRLGRTVGEVAAARAAAWSRMSRLSTEGGGDPDGLASDWWALALGGLGIEGDSTLAEWAETEELRIETASVVPNPWMADLVRDLPEGFPVIAASDMYLSSRSILGMLHAHGLSRIREVLVSGERRAQKRTGRLFPLISDALSVPAGDILHIGDDPLADGVMAERAGLRSIVVDCARTRGIRRDTARALRMGPAGAALAAERSALDVSGSGSGHWEAGRTAFGPIYAPFVGALAEAIVASGCRQAWFLAREGVLLRDLYELRRAQGDGLAAAMPPSGYMPISRLAALRATMSGIGDREFASVAANAPFVSCERLLKVAGVDAAMADAIARRCGLSGGGAMLERGSEAAARVFSDSETVRAAAETGRRNRAGFAAWVDGSGLLGAERVAVVDLGWGAQIQDYLVDFLAGTDRAPEVVGFYLGTDAKAEERRARGRRVNALLVDATRGDGRGMGLFDFLIGLEMGTRAAHPTVTGYLEDGTAVLADADSSGRMVEAADDPAIASLQEGVLEFARHWFPAAIACGVAADGAAGLAALRAETLSLLPPPDIARPLLGFTNVANLGSDEQWRAGGTLSALSPRRSWALLRDSFWQEGTASASFGRAASAGILAAKAARRLLRGSVQARRGREPFVPMPPLAAIERRPGAAVCAPDALYLEAVAERLALSTRGDPAGVRGETLAATVLADRLLSLYHGRRASIAIASWARAEGSAAIRRHLPPRLAAILRRFRHG